VKSYEIVLDIEKDLYAPSNLLFTVSRNDLDSVELHFIIKSDNTKIDLTGHTLELAIMKPSGHTVYQPVELREATEGRGVALLSIQAYIEAGVHKAELYIRMGEKMAVTSAFYYQSREAIMQTTEIESVNDWSALHRALFVYAKKPILTDGIPNSIPEYIGQLAFDITNKRVFFAKGLDAGSWSFLEGGSSGDGGVVSWGDIIGKPTLYPPDEHFHSIEEVEGLQEILNTIPDEGTTTVPEAHTHTWDEIENKPEQFPPVSHNHEITEINGLQDELETKAEFEHIHTWDEIEDKPTEFPPAAHTHNEYLTEAEADTRYALRDSEGGIVESVEWASVINKPTEFPPTAHTHVFGEIEGLTEAFDEKANVDHSHTWDEIALKPTEFPPEAHTHEEYMTIEETDLFYAKREELLEKSDVGHSHEIAEVNGLTDALNSKVEPADLEGFAKTEDLDGFAKTEDLGAFAKTEDLGGLTFWQGTQAEYDAIPQKDPNRIYFVI
jgi:hypothetical protein